MRARKIATRIAARRFIALYRRASPDEAYQDAFVKLLLRKLREDGAEVPDEAVWDLNKHLHHAFKLENLARVGKPLPGNPFLSSNMWLGFRRRDGKWGAQVTIGLPYLRVDGAQIVEAGLREAQVQGDVRGVLLHPSADLLEHLHNLVSSSVLHAANVTRPIMRKLQHEAPVKAMVRTALDRRAEDLYGLPVGGWEYMSSPHEPTSAVHVVEKPGMNLEITLYGIFNINLEDFGAERTANKGPVR